MSELERRILRFFLEHPQAVETTRGMAVWIGAEAAAVEKALEGLAACGGLVIHETAAVKAYSLTRDGRALAQIQHGLEGR